MAHLVAISSHAGKNLMPNYNLGAIWGPSLLTVDSMEASSFAQTSNESDVCRDLIGKKHALKRYDRFAPNTSCFCGSTGSVVQFHEIFVTKVMNKLFYYYC